MSRHENRTQQQEAIRSASPTPVEGIDTHDRVYTMVSINSEDVESLRLIETKEKPRVSGNIDHMTYSTSQFCETSSPKHLAEFKEKKSLGNVVFFDTLESAVLAGFQPCGECMVNPNQAAEGITRWSEYLTISEQLHIQAKSPGKKFWREVKNDPHIQPVVDLARVSGCSRKQEDELIRDTLIRTPFSPYRVSRLQPIVEKILDSGNIDEKTYLSSIKNSVEVFGPMYQYLDSWDRKWLNDSVYDSVMTLAKSNRIEAADAWSSWLEKIKYADEHRRLAEDETVDMRQVAVKTRYLDTFLPLITREDADAVGTFMHLANATDSSSVHIDELITENEEIYKQFIKDMPRHMFEGIIHCYEEAGIVNRTASDKIKLSSKADKDTLTHEYLVSVDHAHKRLDKISYLNDTNGNPPLLTVEDIATVYAKYNETKNMGHIEIPIVGNSERRWIISGIGIGHQDASVDYMIETIKLIRDLPEDQKPQVVIINNLLAGAFENRSKNQKPALVPTLDTLEKQFHAGRIMLDELQRLGIPVVLNLGNPDWEIARDMVLRILRYQFSLVGHIPYYEQDELQRLSEWGMYDRFVVDVALPYCLRKGEVFSARTLLTLFDVHTELEHAKSQGREPEILDDWRTVIDVDAVPIRGTIDVRDGLYITDNFSLTLKGEGDSVKNFYYDDFNFSTSAAPPLYQEPIKSLNTRVTQGLSTGDIQPGQSFTIFNQRELIGVALDDAGTWVDSMPSVQTDSFLDTRGARKRSPDASRRQAVTRRRMGSVASTIVENTPGRKIYHPMSEMLIDLANSTDRTTLVINGDEQTGSVTARLDLAVKSFHMGADMLAKNKVIWGHFGDEVQGQNYKEKAHQESAVGMQVDIDHQVYLYNLLLEMSLSHVTESHMKNLLDLFLLPGNHQLNSGFGQYGITHMQSTVETWNRIAKEKHSPVRAHISENVVTADGSFFRGNVAKISIGAYNWLVQHYPLKKGGKGMGSLPAYQVHALLESLGGNGSDISGFHFQHYHQSSIHMISGGRPVTIGPSRASQSEFEHFLGHKSTPGVLQIHLGGGLLPAFEFLSPRALHAYTIPDDSFFSDKNLRDLGFTTDPNFNPVSDGFMPWVAPFDAESLLRGNVPKPHPQSALQKYIWHLATSIPLQAHTSIGV